MKNIIKILCLYVCSLITGILHADMNISVSRSRATQLKREFYQHIDAYMNNAAESEIQAAQKIINTLELDPTKQRSAHMLRAELERITGKKTPSSPAVAAQKIRNNTINTSIDVVDSSTNYHHEMPLSLEEQLMQSNNFPDLLNNTEATLAALEKPAPQPSPTTEPLHVAQTTSLPQPSITQPAHSLQTMLQHELDTSNNAIVQAQQQLQQHSALHDVLKSIQQLTKDTERNMQITQQSTKLTNQQVDQLKKEFGTLQLSVSSSHNQYNLLQAALDKKLQDQMNSIAELDQHKKMMITGLQADLDNLNDSLDGVNSRISQLRKDLSDQQEQKISGITTTCQEQKHTITALEKELSTVRSNLDMLCKNTQSHHELTEQRLALHEKQQTTIATLQQELTSTSSSLSTLKQQLASYQELEKKVAHKQEVVAVQKSLEELTQELRVHQELNQKSRTLAQKAAQEIQEKNMMIEQLSDEMATVQASLAALRSSQQRELAVAHQTQQENIHQQAIVQESLVNNLQEEIAALKVALQEAKDHALLAMAPAPSLQENINVPAQETITVHHALDEMIDLIKNDLQEQRNTAPIRLLSAR